MKYESLARPRINGYFDKFRWSHQDKPEEALILSKGIRVVFHPQWSNGTVGVRCNKAINRQRAKCYWEILVKDRVFGTSMMFGITTRAARLHDTSFSNLIGENQFGWGLSHKGLIWHNGNWKVYTKPFIENRTTVIGCLYDGELGTLTFYKDGISLGVAFSGLNQVNEKLYPTVSSTAAKTEFCMMLAQREFSNLQERCRHVIRQRIRSEWDLGSLNAPDRLLTFLEMNEEDELDTSTEDIVPPVDVCSLPSPFKWYQPSVSLAQLSKAGFKSNKIPMPDL